MKLRTGSASTPLSYALIYPRVHCRCRSSTCSSTFFRLGSRRERREKAGFQPVSLQLFRVHMLKMEGGWAWQKREGKQSVSKSLLVMICAFFCNHLYVHVEDLCRDTLMDRGVSELIKRKTQHESTGSVSKLCWFDRFSWRSARSRARMARTPGDSTLTLILCQDVEHHRKQFESVQRCCPFIFSCLGLPPCMKPGHWGLTAKEYQAKCPEYTDSEAQLVQVLVIQNFRRAQFWNCPFSIFHPFRAFHVVQWFSQVREKIAAEDFVSDVELQVMNYGFLVLFLSLHKVAKRCKKDQKGSKSWTFRALFENVARSYPCLETRDIRAAKIRMIPNGPRWSEVLSHWTLM